MGVMRLSRLLGGVLCAVVMASPQVDARPSGCKRLKGDFTSVTIAPPACNSPVGLCTHGLLTGKLRGTYDFVALTLVSANDPSAPNKVVYTGESLIETDDGQMFGQDTGYMFLDPMGISPFQTTVHVVGGTEEYQHVSQDSYLVAAGNLVLGTGQAVGTYRGSLCRNHRCDADSDDD